MRTFSLFVVLALVVTACAPLFAQTIRTDDAIHDEVMRRLSSDRDVRGGAITVDVKGGVVTLSGKVREEKQKARAERVTKKVKGVKQVVNQLQVELASQPAPTS